MDEKKTRASVPPFDARDDVVTTSSSRHRARARIPRHAIPFHSLGPIDRWARECVIFFTYLVFEDGVYGEDGWVVCVP